MEKNIKNPDAITCMLGLASTRVTNNNLEVAREKRQKKKEIKKRQKAEAITAKWRIAKRKKSLSNE